MNVQTISKPVTLVASSNKFLQYPVAGVLETAEFGVDGQIIWATFRQNKPNACAVMVRQIETA